jgi:hypothetical protein
MRPPALVRARTNAAAFCASTVVVGSSPQRGQVADLDRRSRGHRGGVRFARTAAPAGKHERRQRRAAQRSRREPRRRVWPSFQAGRVYSRARPVRQRRRSATRPGSGPQAPSATPFDTAPGISLCSRNGDGTGFRDDGRDSARRCATQALNSGGARRSEGVRRSTSPPGSGRTSRRRSNRARLVPPPRWDRLGPLGCREAASVCAAACTGLPPPHEARPTVIARASRTPSDVDRRGIRTPGRPALYFQSFASYEGASAAVSERFQATNCAVLKFTPKFTASTSGHTSKAKGASLSVNVSYPKGPFGSQANIKSVKVDLPKLLPSRLTTLQKGVHRRAVRHEPRRVPGRVRRRSRKGYHPAHSRSLGRPGVLRIERR